jgi:hypothetical protein
LLLSAVDVLKDDLKQTHTNTQTLVQRCEELSNENKALKKTVSELSDNLNRDRWRNFSMRHRENKCLLIGDSVLNDIDSDKLINTHVDCLQNGSVEDVLQHLNENKDCYSEVTVCVGSVDCADDEAVSENLIESYKEVIKVAKDMVPQVTNIKIASIPPNVTSKLCEERVDDFNTRLASIASNTGVKFVNNDAIFKLSDGSPNDGCVSGIGRNLTHSGTNRLARNLMLHVKQAHKDDVCRKIQEARVLRPHQRDQHNGWVQAARRKRHPVSYDRPTPSKSYSSMTSESNRGCWNCGEYNHHANTCRHGKRIVCHQCESPGHKAKFCSRR